MRERLWRQGTGDREGNFLFYYYYFYLKKPVSVRMVEPTAATALQAGPRTEESCEGERQFISHGIRMSIFTGQIYIVKISHIFKNLFVFI